MFSNDTFGRVATAAIGALIFTTVSLGAAVGPAQSVEISPVYALSGAAQNPAQANG